MRIVFDGHNDLLHELIGDAGFAAAGGTAVDVAAALRTFTEGRAAGAGHLDRPRLRAGGMAGGLLAVFAPSPHAPDDLRDARAFLPTDSARARARDHTLAGVALALALERAGAWTIARDAATLRAGVARGTEQVTWVLHVEGAEAIAPDLALLEVLHAAGLRSLGPVWSRPNVFGEGVPFRYGVSPDTGPGMTAAGKDLVRACNDLGVLIDLAHLNERGFWDVAALTRAPLVVSHTGVHALSAAARNVTDAQIDAVGGSGGLFGLTYHVADLRADNEQDADVPLAVMAAHLEHVAERIGPEHVALGSDFDGALIPAQVGDAAGLPGLLDHLAGRGWSEEHLALLARENWLRVLETTWAAP